MVVEDNVCPVTLFDKFVAANTFRTILQSFNKIRIGLKLDDANQPADFYLSIQRAINSWKAQKLWGLLNKRASHKEYNGQRAAEGLRVLVVGAGPCGLRMAIECALLGAKVVVLEKRDRFSRNNVLHLWPFVIHDLKSLGAKLFYPKFCAGSIDHISIRQLQCLLLKIALVVGVEVHEGTSFEDLIEPSTEGSGWRAKVSPQHHFISDYEFDVLIGADGKRNTIKGFRRKEFRGKLAIGITANFINRHTQGEEQVPEISGVAFIFNQQFFKDLKTHTGVDLENIVYYKDDTHYFVMCAKKQSLLDKGVIMQDSDDAQRLLDPDNVDLDALLAYARQAADFSTEGALPQLDYAVNHFGLPDVAMFDFTSLFSAENSSRILERNSVPLLISIVGDSLHEPFWPTGSGCARGFLSVLDTAWMIRNYSSNAQMTNLDILAERESTYRLLAQSTPENLHKNLGGYSINPGTRYPNLDSSAVLPHQVQHLIDSDTETTGTGSLARGSTSRARSPLISKGAYAQQQALVTWCQQVVTPYKLRVENVTTSLRSGLVLCAIIHRFRPDLLSYGDLNPRDYGSNLLRALDILQEHFELEPPQLLRGVASGSAWVCLQDIKSEMFAFMTSVHGKFKGLTPATLSPQNGVSTPKAGVTGVLYGMPTKPLVSHGLSPKVRAVIGSPDAPGPTPQKMPRKTSSPRSAPAQDPVPFKKLALEEQRKLIREKLKERRLAEIGEALFGPGKPITRSTDISLVEKIAPERLAEVENLLKGHLSPTHERTRKEKQPKVKARKLEAKDIEDMEQKLKDTAMGCLYKVNPPKAYTSKDEKLVAAKTSDMRKLAQNNFESQSQNRFAEFDSRLKSLGYLESQKAGVSPVALLKEQHAQNIAAKQNVPGRFDASWKNGVAASNGHSPATSPPPVPQRSSPRSPSKPLYLPPETGNPTCYFCDARVYLAERMCVEGLYMHKGCFRCEYCSMALRLNNYGFDRNVPTSQKRGRFYCMTHLNLPPEEKLSKAPPIIKSPPPPTPPKPSNKVPTCPLSYDKPYQSNGDTKSTTPSMVTARSSAISTPERAEFEFSLKRKKAPAWENAPKAEEESVSDLEAESSDEEEIEEELINLHNLTFSTLSSDEVPLSRQNPLAPLQSHQQRSLLEPPCPPGGGDMSESDQRSSPGLDESDTEDEDDLTAAEAAELEKALRSHKVLTPEATLKLAATWKRRRSLDNLLDEGKKGPIMDKDGPIPDSSHDETDTTEDETSFTENGGAEDIVEIHGKDVASALPVLPNPPSRSMPPPIPSRLPPPLKLDLKPPKASPLSGGLEQPQQPIPFADTSPPEVVPRRRGPPRDSYRRMTVAITSGDLPPDCGGHPERPQSFRLSPEEAELRRGASQPPDLEMVRQSKIEQLAQLRSEARARARLKSDVELGLKSDYSPYIKAPIGTARSAPMASPETPQTPTSLTSPAEPPKSPMAEVAKRKLSGGGGLLAKLFGNLSVGSSPEKHAPERAPPPPPVDGQQQGVVSNTPERNLSPPVPTETYSSESTKETSLLGKIGRKYKKKKEGRKAKGVSHKNKSEDVQDSSLKKTDSLSSLKSTDSGVSDRDVKRVERAIARLIRQQEVTIQHQAGEIQRRLQELEVRKCEIVERGREIESVLLHDPRNQDMLRDWITLVTESSSIARQENDLQIKATELELEEKHSRLQQELRMRLSVPAHQKSKQDLEKEQTVLEEMLKVVSQRDSLATKLDLEKGPQEALASPGAQLKEKGFNYQNFNPVFLSTKQEQDVFV